MTVPGDPARSSIAVGAAALGDGAGMSRYVEELLNALDGSGRRLTVFTTSRATSSRYGRAAIRLPRWVGRSNFAGNAARLVWHQTRLPRELRRSGADIFFSPVPEGMIRPVLPQVVGVPDLLPLVHPEGYPRLRHYFQTVLPRILGASSAIVAMSESTRRDVQRFFPEVAARVPVEVVPAGVRHDMFSPPRPADADSVRARYGLGRFVLVVGALRPYKNHRSLFEAIALVRDPTLSLAVVGRTAGADRAILDAPAALGVRDRVRFLGEVPDTDLPSLYGAAEALVFPSLYEGFGLPPLEAMACGCPVVSSRAASLPEVCGDAALLVDADRPHEIAAAIDRITGDPELAAELRGRGLQQAARFSFERSASDVLRLLDSILEGEERRRNA